MKYYVEGKVFDTETEAMDYEKELNAEKERKLNLEKEKENRKAELAELKKAYNKALAKYLEDYGKYDEKVICGDVFPYTVMDNFMKKILG